MTSLLDAPSPHLEVGAAPPNCVVDGLSEAVYTASRMIVPIDLDRLLQFAGVVAARAVRHWSPVRQGVTIRIEDAGYERLVDWEFDGEIMAYDPTIRGTPLLISLNRKLRYEDSLACYCIDVVVARSALRWHAPERLLITWNAVRLIDAPSFADSQFGRTIGTARLMLR